MQLIKNIITVTISKLNSKSFLSKKSIIAFIIFLKGFIKNIDKLINIINNEINNLNRESLLTSKILLKGKIIMIIPINISTIIIVKYINILLDIKFLTLSLNIKYKDITYKK